MQDYAELCGVMESNAELCGIMQIKAEFYRVKRSFAKVCKFTN